MQKRHPLLLAWISMAALNASYWIPAAEGRGIRRPAPRPATRPAAKPAPRQTTRPSSNLSKRSSSSLGRNTPLSKSPSSLPATNPAARPAPGSPGSGWSPGIGHPTSLGKPLTPARPVRPQALVAPAKPLPSLPNALVAGDAAARHNLSRSRTVAAFTASPTLAANPSRTLYRNRRLAHATAVRATLRPRCSVIFTPNWWHARRHLWHATPWHYCHHHRPYHWWRWATWAGVRTWVIYSWEDPMVYEYNDNVVFEDGAVYVNEEPVATAEDYIEMGDELAGIPEPEPGAEVEWLPLGVFAMAASEDDMEPQMMVQLVVSKDGRIGGTYYHYRTQNMHGISGSVDEETQRAAFKIGDQTDNLLEVGLAGLAEGEAPVWVHFGKGGNTQTWTLIRMEAPPAAKSEVEAEAPETPEAPEAPGE